MEPIVGIDLGTTNSEVAFIIDGCSTVLIDGDNGIVPSVVGIDDNGQIVVGREALNQAVLAPERTVRSVKRRMGSPDRIPMGENTYLPQEISACILKALKRRAENYLNRPISKAVITVPAYFTDVQRQATREAGEIAGLEVVRIINEPTAASLAYESKNPETQTILVYDLGGGTFDVSIVRIEKGIVEVLSSTGDNQLGGDDFDNRIVNLLVRHIQETYDLDVSSNPLTMARLKRAAEAAKIALSENPFVQIEEDHIGERKGKPIHLSYELSRMDFVEMIQEYLDRTMDSVTKALKDALMLPSAIDKIILVGGSTRIPQISNMLEDKFGKLPHSEIDPDLCVALGAAIQAGREMGLDSTSVLLDVTPYTFGTSALGEVGGKITPYCYVPIIRRNTKLPTHRAEVFWTIDDNQEAVEVTVYQGEEPISLDNVLLGKFYFRLTPAPRGSEIVLNFDLDINGILKVQAVEKFTGKKIEGVIENAIGRFNQKEIADLRQRVDTLWKEEAPAATDSTAPEETNQAIPPEIQSLLEKASQKLEAASEEDRDEMINLMEDIRDALREGQMENARDLAKDLEDIVYYID
uniref:Heat-shock protein Hsp70 n=1 Tax=Desulfatirhabdium butyrativorans TaxID=340467 RepID=A0A7C4MN81_9BACT